MYEIIKLLFDICLFRKGPQDLPYSTNLLKFLITVYALIRFLMLKSTESWVNTLLQITFEIVIVAAFSWIILYLDRKTNRFCQVTSAFFGTYSLLGFSALPALASMAIGRVGWMVFLVMIALTGWFCAVTAHIIHHALDQRLGLSIGMAFLFLMVSYLLLDFLFPDLPSVS